MCGAVVKDALKRLLDFKEGVCIDMHLPAMLGQETVVRLTTDCAGKTTQLSQCHSVILLLPVEIQVTYINAAVEFICTHT